MENKPKNPIIKWEDFTVEHAVENEYGDLIVTSTDNNNYKVGNKRAHLFIVFEEGKKVSVGYASYMNKDYIAEAKQLELPEESKEPKSKPSKEPEISGQRTGMITKEIGDLIKQRMLVEIFGTEVALELIKWYRGEILATTRVPYDEAKLPQFKKTETKKEAPVKEGDIPY